MNKNYSIECLRDKRCLISKVFRNTDLTECIFDGCNLQGADFTNQDLTGSSFNGCDIRGTNFRNAILKGCSFKEVHGGLKPSKAFFKSILMTALNAIIIIFLQTIGQRSFAIFSVNSLGLPDSYWENSVILAIIILIVFVFSANTKKGLKNAFEITIIAIVIVLPFIITVLFFIALIKVYSGDVFSSNGGYFNNFLSRSMVGLATGVGIIFLSLAIAVNKTVIKIIYKSKNLSTLTLIVDLLTVVLLTIFQIKIGVDKANIIPSILLSFTGITLGYYWSKQALTEKIEYALISNVAINVASWDGTDFRGSDLTNVNFNHAILKSVNFKNSDLKKTNINLVSWFRTRELHLALIGDTYLKYPHVRKLLIERKGERCNFDNLNLEGINLEAIDLGDDKSEQKTRLAGASFYRTNLNNANLKYTDLSKTNLTQTQLDNANLTGSILTGACIEDWGITRSTKREDIVCKYIFEHWPTKEEDPDDYWRIPLKQHKDFEDDDFQVYIESILDTLELYHKQKIDPIIIIKVLEEITRENNNVEVKITGFNDRGNGQSTLRLKIHGKISHSQLRSKYYDKYSQYENNIAMGRPIGFLSDAGKTAVYLMTVDNQDKGITVYNGGTHITNYVMNENFNTQFNDSTIGNFANKLTDHASQQSTQHIGTEQKPLAEAAAEIQRLLKQLEQNNPTATESQQIDYVNISIKPELKQRAIAALQEGGEVAIDEFILDNKYFKVIKALVKGWYSPL